MKIFKPFLTATWIAAALLPGLASHALNNVVYAGVGSSAMFTDFAQGAFAQINNSGIAPGGLYTRAKGATTTSFLAHDPTTGAPLEQGQIWIVWDNAAANNHKIYLYLQTDSTVGNRLFFNKGNLQEGTAVPPAAATTTATNGDDILKNISGLPNFGRGVGFDSPGGIPQDVLDAVLGQGTYNANNTNFAPAIPYKQFSAGMTDVTPYDSKIATEAVFNSGLYGNRPVGNAIIGATGGSVFPVEFSISNRPNTIQTVGACPIVFIVNKVADASGPYANISLSSVTNIDRFTAGLFLSGQATRTSDLINDITVSGGAGGDPTAGGTGAPVATFVREPISGTYLTTEYCVPASVEVASSQELNVGSSALNDANWSSSTFAFTNGGRVRAVGTGALVSAVNNTHRALGYTFWGTGNLNPNNQANIKYITLDGSDPIAADSAYTGSIPTSVNPGTTGGFRNVINGGYAAWSRLRAVIDSAASANKASIVDLVSLASIGGSNYVPATQIRFFRSHYNTLNTFSSQVDLSATGTGDVPMPVNGTVPNDTELGADAGGAVFGIQTDRDFFFDNGVELTNIHQ